MELAAADVRIASGQFDMRLETGAVLTSSDGQAPAVSTLAQRESHVALQWSSVENESLP